MNNFNLVLRTYTAMRQMTADDLALLNTLRALGDTDREKLIEAMSDNPQKKAGKKSADGGGGRKSKHASSLASAIKGTAGDVTVPLTGVEAKTSVGQLGVKIEEDGVLSSGGGRCQFVRADGKLCLLLPDHNIHHMTTAREYHEFVAPPTTGKSDAHSAAGGS